MERIQLKDEIELLNFLNEENLVEDSDIRNWSCESNNHTGIESSCIDLLCKDDNTPSIISVKRVWLDRELIKIELIILN